jgi:hypothetical protein
MLREIRAYCRTTGLSVRSEDSSMAKTFGFTTVCSEFDTRDRQWVISLARVSLTSKSMDVDFDGEVVRHEAQREILWRYVRLMKTPELRKLLAQALSTGQHPDAKIPTDCPAPAPSAL